MNKLSKLKSCAKSNTPNIGQKFGIVNCFFKFDLISEGVAYFINCTVINATTGTTIQIEESFIPKFFQGIPNNNIAPIPAANKPNPTQSARMDVTNGPIGIMGE